MYPYDHFLEKHTFRFHSGGSAIQQVQAAPVPTPAPPVTTTNAQVVQAQHDLAQQELLKKNIKKTVYAGDTGGYGKQGSPDGNLPVFDGAKGPAGAVKPKL